MSLIGQITGLRPSKIGIPKLAIQIAVESQFDANVAILAVNSEVRVSASATSFDAWASAQFLGYAVWESYLSQLPKGGKTTWEVGLPLSPFHLQKIEEARNGRDIWLMVHSTFTAAAIPNAGTTNYGAFMSGMLSDPSRSAGNCIHKIARSDWLRLRKELGYGEHQLIEIPLRIPAKKGMGKALEHLEAASDHLAEDRPDETLASCYKAFEYLARTAGAKNPDQNGFERLLGSIEDLGKKNKLKMLMHYLCQYFHLGRHEPGKVQVVVDRRDAEYALILSQATLAYMAKHWSESPDAKQNPKSPHRSTQ